MPLSLRPIEKSHISDCFALRLKPGQEGFVSHPIQGLAPGYPRRDVCAPLGLCAGETLVGCGMLLCTPEEKPIPSGTL